MIKGSVRNSGRNYHKSVGNGTLCLSRRTVYSNELIGSLADRAKGSRVTAVKVKRINTSKLKHYLSLLVNSKTHSLRRLASICGHGNNLTVCRHTDSLTGILGNLIETACYRSILNDVLPSAYSFFDLTLIF